MRIDAALPLPENQPASKVANSGSSVQQNRSAPASSGQDQAQLSIDKTTIQSLTAQVARLPEVRQDRVDALRQAVSSGNYRVSDQQVSDAIGSDLMAGQLRLA